VLRAYGTLITATLLKLIGSYRGGDLPRSPTPRGRITDLLRLIPASAVVIQWSNR
jgi:hypothetical protein